MARQFQRESEDQRLPAFVGKLTLERRGDVLRDVEQDPNYVRLLTVHGAKGTEYPIVVMVAMEEGIFPHHLSEKEGRVDEERRGCFVAMTRTEERLVLSLAQQRKDSYGRPWPKEPSRFIQEIAAELEVDLDDPFG
jgi:DNA helicase-2/ATP-dependent DNA helicase PcrA